MYRRSRAREVALQLLFQLDRNPSVDRPSIERFARERLREPDLVQFCLSLYDGTKAKLTEIDAALAAAADNWALHRMAVVDRNVLRLGSHEVLANAADTPPIVAVTEAVDLARRYGSANSSAFVNGVLEKVRITAAQAATTGKALMELEGASDPAQPGPANSPQLPRPA